MFVCPSQPAASPGPWNTYAVCTGDWDYGGDPRPGNFAEFLLTNHRGIANVYQRRSLSISEVVDGTTTTAAFSERVRGPRVTGAKHRSFPWHKTVPGDTKADFQRACIAGLGKPSTGTFYDAEGDVSWIFMRPRALTTYNHLIPPNHPYCSSKFVEQSQRRPPPLHAGAAVPPSSWHHGGVNVCMVDGHVRFVSDSVDIVLWNALGTRAGQEQVDQNQF